MWQLSLALPLPASAAMYGLSFLSLCPPRSKVSPHRLSPRVTTHVHIVLLAQGLQAPPTCTSLLFVFPFFYLLLTARFPLSSHLYSCTSCVTQVLLTSARLTWFSRPAYSRPALSPACPSHSPHTRHSPSFPAVNSPNLSHPRLGPRSCPVLSSTLFCAHPSHFDYAPSPPRLSCSLLTWPRRPASCYVTVGTFTRRGLSSTAKTLRSLSGVSRFCVLSPRRGLR